MPVHIKLRGSEGEQFEEIKGRLEDELGYEPSNTEVLGILMAGVDSSGRCLSDATDGMP